jgi:hypothetical protein
MKQVDEVIEKLGRDSHDLGIKLFPPATSNEIEILEKSLSYPLPSELKYFYQQCNGFEADEDIFRVISINDLMEEKHDLGENEFHFAEYLIYSDTWDIRIINSESYTIFNNDHGGKVNLNLTQSIIPFLNRYVELKGGIFGENGLCRWHEEVLNKK